MTKQASSPVAGPHIVRYGTAADQKFLLGDFLDTYDQLVINATMAAHMPAALASFLMQRAKNKPYFIDPQTHAFQHEFSNLESSSPNREGEVKRSADLLATAYGDPVRACVDRHEAVLPKDFLEPKLRAEFCERVIRFQVEQIAKQAESEDVVKYYEFLKGKGMSSGANVRPTLVVPPYFYLTANTIKRWLPINVACAVDGQKTAGALKIPIGVQIVISQDVLMSDSLLGDVIKEYKKVQPDVFLIWIDAFSEHAASEEELRALVKVVQELGKRAPVVNLYGGFFSVALRLCGLTTALVGIAHGLEYGEDRGVLPVGGGIPVAKFYLPQLHMRLPFRDAVRSLAKLEVNSVADFHTKVCNCPECHKVISTNPGTDFMKYGESRPISFRRRGQPTVVEFPLPETRARTVRHYMWSKASEYQLKLKPAQIVHELQQEQERLERVLALSTVAHCEIWATLLSGK